MGARWMWASVVSVAAWGLSAWSVLAQPAGGGADSVAATVNGEKIMKSEVEAILGTRPNPNMLTAQQKQDLQKQVFDMLIDDALMRQFLRKNSPAVTPQDVQKKLNELAADLKQKNTSVEEYLKQSGQTLEQLKADIAAAIQW